jgi:UDP-GlcNAc:undecaprenyl-phosphate GlcNAc-1-phosphate transferase
MSIYYLSSFFAPFLLTLALIPVVRKIALGKGFVDTPSARKIHSQSIPLGGGIPIFLGLVLTTIALTQVLGLESPRASTGIIAGAILIFFIGIYDDAFEMGALPKMLGQIIAATIFLSFAEDVVPVISYPAYLILGTLWIVGIQNAMNFLDNMDGLCAGVAIAIAIGLGVLFVLKDMTIYAMISFALAGGALGFLRYNLPPASIFLGDTGSLLFGYALSCLAIIHIGSSRDMAAALSPFIIMAYPIFDISFVTISRLNEGRKVYIGGKDHSSHKISFMGFTRKFTVLAIHLINLLLVCFGILTYFISGSPYQTLLVAMLAFGLAFTGTHLYKNFLYLDYRVKLILADICSIITAFGLYLLLKHSMGATVASFSLELADAIISLAWISIFWVVLFAVGGFYDIPPESRFREHSLLSLKLIFSGALFFALANFRPFEGFQVSIASLILFSLLFMGTNFICRGILYHGIGNAIRYRSLKVDAVIARPSGSAEPSYKLAPFIQDYNILGYAGMKGPSDLEYLGEIEGLGHLMRDRRVARIILDIPAEYHINLMPIFNCAFFMDTRFLAVSPLPAICRGLKVVPSRFEGIYLVSPGHRRIFSRIIKRVFDCMVCGMILCLCAPWFGYKLLNGKAKNINISDDFSFVGVFERTKIARCRKVNNSVKLRNPWGLLTVFKGDLSLVGPTISPVEEGPHLAGFWRKFAQKPGLFGPGYEGIDCRERFDLDLKYLEKPSLIYDLGILTRQIIGISRIKGIGIKDA